MITQQMITLAAAGLVTVTGVLTIQGTAAYASVPAHNGTTAAGGRARSGLTVASAPVQKVNHSNVGATHSPRLLRELAGPPGAPGMVNGALAGAVRGVDVASYQHASGAAIHWARVAGAGIQFAAVKVTEGTYYHNPYALSDLAGARAAGMSAVAYAFAIPNGNGGKASAAAQAGYLLKALGSSARTTPVMLDIEYNPYGRNCYGLSKAAMVSWISAFDTTVQAATGRLPIIYAPGPWWSSCTGGSGAFAPVPLWVPDYATGSAPALPAGWRRWAFWQYSSSGKVRGIKSPGGVDLDQLAPGRLPLLAPGRHRTQTGKPVSVQVAPADRGVAHSPAYTATGLPRGASISPAGKITGAPAEPGKYWVTVRAAQTGRTGAVAFGWRVRAAG
ncbi:MAG: GH25 family lysozyme [Streptosporangiaceae bacterium]